MLCVRDLTSPLYKRRLEGDLIVFYMVGILGEFMRGIWNLRSSFDNSVLIRNTSYPVIITENCLKTKKFCACSQVRFLVGVKITPTGARF